MIDGINETPSATLNFQTKLAAQLADLVPEAIADGKVDIEKLKDLLEDDTDDANERFGLFWPGKKRALKAAQEPTTATLQPNFESSRDWRTTKNAFIEGDNLEVLKILQQHYHAKIKMIYIDPPYNTGQDFIYMDNYKEGLEAYLEWTRQVNEEGKKLTTNTETEGRYHSNWLNMMYPRLKLARNLLTDDGAIFISIDDHEQDNLKRLCCEIFGEANVEVLVWNKEAEGSSGTLKAVSTFRRVHEYVIVCHKNFSEAQWLKVHEALEGREDEFQTANLAVNAKNERENHKNYFSITGPHGDVYTRQWKWSREEVDHLIKDDLIYWGSDGKRQPRLIIPTDDRRTTYLKSILNYGGTTTGKKDFETVMGEEIEFSYPKPILLLKKLILTVTSEEDIVLDFFSGSGSTACAVIEANTEDGCRRRHIQVQLPEPTQKGSKAREEGFVSIADIAQTRIALAGDQIAQEVGAKLGIDAIPLDVGFRSYRLVDTNFSKWELSSEVESEDLQQYLLGLRKGSRDGEATLDDLLTEILLKQGYSLTEAVSSAEIAGLDVRLVRDLHNNVGVLAYLNEHIKPTLEQLRLLVDGNPQRLIILEDAFQGDDELKTNLAQLCKSKGVEFWSA